MFLLRYLRLRQQGSPWANPFLCAQCLKGSNEQVNQEGSSVGSEPWPLFSGAMNKQLKASLKDGRGLLKTACQLPQSLEPGRNCGVKVPWCEGTMV